MVMASSFSPFCFTCLPKSSPTKPGTEGKHSEPSTPLTFTPGGGNTQTITVATVADAVVENDETLTVTLDSVNGGGAAAALGTSTAVGTIENDDATSFSIAVRRA